MPRLQVRIGQHADAGRQPVQQDFHGAVLPEGALRERKGIAIALADGIGSSAVSQVASAAAVRGFLDDYYATSDAWPVRRAAQRVLDATNAWLHGQNQRSAARFDRHLGQVCTFSALVLKGREAHLLHVGDGRICRLHPQALEPLTEEHRVHLPDGDGGVDTRLARALGAGPTVEIDYRCWPAEPGEVYLLATDGAWEHLDAAAVHTALAAHPDDLDAAAAALVASALARGSDDNLTVQLVCIDALPDATDALLPAPRSGLALPPPLAPRMDFEGYTIVRELQASPRSHVHLAVDAASGRQVVIKTPAAEGREDPAVLDRFVLEDWVARRVDSPHLLKPCASERPRRHLFVAMEYIDGCTLAQWMTDHPAPDLATVRGLVAQIAKGLQALHRKAMLHQDLRPENILIDAHGTARIIDFGAVHVAGLAEGTGQRATGGGSGGRPLAIPGALQYAAPEYFCGEAGSPASDSFALAVLAYQMLTGHLPYGLQVTQVRGPADLARLRYQPVRAPRPDLPPWLDGVLRQALHPQPARRHEALSAFVHELHHPPERHLRSRGTPLAARDPLRFWRALSLLLGLAVVGLLGLRVLGG